jgi:asparagine synthase (glutamine-hydrolysing)
MQLQPATCEVGRSAATGTAPFLAHVDLRGRPAARSSAGRAVAALSGGATGEAWLEVRGRTALGAPWPAAGAAQEGDATLVLDGRLDNRSELRRQLGDRRPEASDAALALAAYRLWGRGAFERLEGPFALVVRDDRRGCVIAARDALGDRPLSYTERDGVVRIATHERALLADPAVSRRVDESSAARYFDYRAPAEGATWFEDVRSVPPGCLLVVEGDRHVVERFTRLRPTSWTAGGEAESVELFGEVFGRAVVRRLAGTDGPAGVLMSGGLDSTSVAAVAAADGSARGAAPTLVTWTLDSPPGCDERFQAAAVAQHLGLGLLPVAATGLLPLEPGRPLPEVPERPGSDLYHPLLAASFTAASQAGLRVLLSGHHANALWQGGDGWLRDLVSRGRFATGLALLVHLLRTPTAGAERWRRLRGAASRLAGRRPGESVPEWLTPFARQRLQAATDAEPEEPWGPLRTYWTEEAVRLRRLAADHGLDLRLPYRDRRLVEMMVGLPADLLYRPHVTKWLQRESMRGLLPEAARARLRPTNLYLWAECGLLRLQRREFLDRLAATRPVWDRYVDPGWLLPRVEATSPDSLTVHLAWRCLAFADWSALSGKMVGLSSFDGTLGRGVSA